MFIVARKLLWSLMRPAGSCLAPMQPLGQFEFETPVLEHELKNNQLLKHQLSKTSNV